MDKLAINFFLGISRQGKLVESKMLLGQARPGQRKLVYFQKSHISSQYSCVDNNMYESTSSMFAR